MWIKDLFKQAAILSVQAIVLCGALAFIYNITPLSEREVKIVVTDKYPVTHSTKPYVIEECSVDDIKLCTYRNVTRNVYENTPIGEVSVLSLNAAESVKYGGSFISFSLSVICFVIAAFHSLIWRYLPQDISPR